MPAYALLEKAASPLPSPLRRPIVLPRLRGFTLIELLAVISIIGVLAAIIIPVVGAVRASARASQCVSNLRQIGIAHQLHLADHNQIIVKPIRTGDDDTAADWNYQWFSKLNAYIPPGLPAGANPLRLNAAFHCPSRRPFGTPASWVTDGMSYAMNSSIPNPANWNYRFSAIPNPARYIFVTECDETQGTASNVEWIRSADGVGNGGTLAQRHSPGKANALFFDSSVRQLAHAAMNNQGLTTPNNVWRWW